MLRRMGLYKFADGIKRKPNETYRHKDGKLRTENIIFMINHIKITSDQTKITTKINCY